MRIKKIFQGSIPENKILNEESTSQTDTYSCAKINEMTEEVYSTEEQLIGTWIDGKPLYRKVIVLENGTGTTSEKRYDFSTFGLNNIDMIMITTPSYYTLYLDNKYTLFPYNYNDGKIYMVSFNITDKIMYVTLGFNGICNNKTVISVLYTKTTD